MAQEVNLVKNNIRRAGLVGFSWTTLFFGFFVPLFRGDWKWCIILLVLGLLSFGLCSLIFCFIYNKIYTRGLLEDGYVAADDYSRELLYRAGILTSNN